MLWKLLEYLKSFFSIEGPIDMVLTPQKLVQLARFPHLSKSWYYIAASTLSVCNQPQEIPKLYHYALKLAQYQDEQSPPDHLKLARDALERSDVLAGLSQEGLTDDAQFTTIENINKNDPELNQNVQFSVSLKTREAILKSLALGGIPKAINALMLLKNVTPLPLRSTETSRDFSPSKAEEDRERGWKYWNSVYGKVSKRVTNQMSTAYPDLWEFTINHVYAPLLSFSDVLSPRESSLVVIACLIPQDVNPQLKGHLKGALNNGCSVEEIESAREMSLLISQWCGVRWRDPVAKIKL